MNLGQTMITMGMFVLLVMSVISANRMLLQNSESNLENEALTESATIANDIFQEAESKKFDKFADETGTQDTSVFSPPKQGANEWGPSAIEAAAVPLRDNSSSGQYRSIDAYDDVDDYNGYTRIVNADSANGIRLDGFLVSVRVFYVDSTMVEVYHRTRDKGIVVTVKNEQYFPEKIKDIGITITSFKSY
jgi:hypothetical protein